MFDYLEKDEVLEAIKLASEETQQEISEDKAGFFNATTALETFREKLEEKINKLDIHMDDPFDED